MSDRRVDEVGETLASRRRTPANVGVAVEAERQMPTAMATLQSFFEDASENAAPQGHGCRQQKNRDQDPLDCFCGDSHASSPGSSLAYLYITTFRTSTQTM